MAKSEVSKRDEQREVSRRALIKWSIAAGAALGVSRSKIFEILEKTGGRDLAFAASTRASRFSVHVDCGNGGLAWMTQLVPFPKIGLAGNNTVSYNFPGQAAAVAGTDKPLVLGPTSPGRTLAAARQWTQYVCGTNETHSTSVGAGGSTSTLGGNALPAVATALQAGDSSVIPILAVGGVQVGTAPGGASGAAVGNSTGMVGLFNSAASRAGGLLSNQNDAVLYKAHYDAFTQLNRAANRSTTKIAYGTASGAAKFLGTNLAAQLTVQPDDLTRYGIDGGTPNALSEMGKVLITAAKAFSLGLTNSVILPSMRDDPHDAFDANRVATVPAQFQKIWDGFFADCTAKIDPITMGPIMDNLVCTWHGDTFKDPGSRGGWGDGTPNNSNIIWALSPGDLKTGCFGDMDATGNTAQTFDPTGNLITYNNANAMAAAQLAVGAIAYSIAKRDDRAIQNFSRVAVGGLVRPKDM